MKVLGINFSKRTADNKFHSELINDYACTVQYCIEKKRSNFALVRESREYAHDVWERSYMVVDVRYDVEFNAKDKNEASKKFAELVKNGAPYDRRAQGGATIGELIAARRV